MEVETNTAQVEALMNLIRSTYPQIVQELSQLSNSVSDGEPPWKKQRVDKNYVNNETAGASKNVLGDVYKYSVVNNINLAFNFTLACGASKIREVKVESTCDGDVKPPGIAANSGQMPLNIIIDSTAPAEAITDAQLLNDGVEATSRFLEIHRSSAHWMALPSQNASTQHRRIFARTKGTQFSKADFEAQGEDFFTVGRIFDLAAAAYYGFEHERLHGNLRFVVVKTGAFCCSAVLVTSTGMCSAPKEREKGTSRAQQRAYGALTLDAEPSSSFDAPIFERALSVRDVNVRAWSNLACYRTQYDSVYTIDYHMRALAVARIAEASLNDFETQFSSVWRRKVEGQGFRRRNSTSR